MKEIILNMSTILTTQKIGIIHKNDILRIEFSIIVYHMNN
jgi:hypothetical protein